MSITRVRSMVPGCALRVLGLWLLATGYWQLIPCFLPEASSEKSGAKMPDTSCIAAKARQQKPLNWTKITYFLIYQLNI